MQDLNLSKFHSFFIYNSTFSKSEETETDKIIFYYPETTTLKEQLQNVGLIEALTAYSLSFSNKKCNSLHLEKNRYVFFEPEKDYWLVLIISNPFTYKMKGNEKIQKFKFNLLSDQTLLQILKNSYRIFYMFYQTFNDLVQKNSVLYLKSILAQFFPFYLSNIDFSYSSIENTVWTALDGIQFCSVHKNLYLRIKCLMNQVKSNFPYVKNSMLLFEKNLVWSSFETEETRNLYHFMCSQVLGQYKSTKSKEFGKEKPTVKLENKESTVFSYQNLILGIQNLVADIKEEHFLTGATLIENKVVIKIPTIFVSESNTQKYQLIIYKSRNLFLLLFLENEAPNLNEISFYQKLSTLIRKEMQSICELLNNGQDEDEKIDQVFNYIYFNSINLSVKQCLNEKRNFSLTDVIPQLVAVSDELLRKKSQIPDEIDNPKTQYLRFIIEREIPFEIISQSKKSVWIVGKKTSNHVFFLIFDQKNVNLNSIEEEMEKFSSALFKDYFFD
ncbi:vacuolar fusion protein ccz1 [Anaeramoeba ignava]|uniref:Vacuolar fusion protein ccz1 n=1 Tax=Anaeramoeba ignava TaxID=1746090 RepID=A0A9Q0L8P0_ANAIG|nr:vacuolar fusion protein ccz1 [Anaeramoeba ignava]